MAIQLIAWCIFAFTIAGFLQGTIGFGFGITVMALLPLFLPVKEAAPLAVLLGLPAVFILFCTHWRHFRLRAAWMLIIGMVVGIPIGVHILAVAPEHLLLRLLGAILLIFSVHELWSQYQGTHQLHVPRWTAFPIAFFSGILSGAFNAGGGPPLVAYVYSRNWSKERIVATLQLLFTISSIIRIGTMVKLGLMSGTVLYAAAWAAIPMIVALTIGIRVFRKIPSDKLRPGVFVFVGLIALKYLLLG